MLLLNERERERESRQSNTIIDAVELSLAPKVMKGIMDRRKLLVGVFFFVVAVMFLSLCLLEGEN